MSLSDKIMTGGNYDYSSSLIFTKEVREAVKELKDRIIMEKDYSLNNNQKMNSLLLLVDEIFGSELI